MKKSLIFETLGSINEMKVEKSDKKGELMTLSGVFGVCGIVNNNNRVYEKSNYEAMVNQMKEIIKSEGGIPGELEHPTTMNITLENVSHKITDISIDEKGVVTGSITLLNTPKGQIAQAIVEGGLPLFVSSRATGEIQEGKVKLSKIFTYDLVGTPGFSQARVKLNENQHIDMLNENICVISEGSTESKEKNMEKNILENYKKVKQVNSLLEGRFSQGWFDPVDKKLGTLKYKDDQKSNDVFNESNADNEFFINGDSVPHDVTVSTVKYGGKLCAKIEIDLNGELGEYDDFYFDYGNYTFSGLNIDNFYFTTSDPKKRVSLTVMNVEMDSDEKGSVYFADKNIKMEFDNPNHEDWVRDGEVDPWPGDDEFEDDDDEFNDNKKVSLEEIKSLIKESEKRTEKFIMEQVAPGIEDWIINDYSPELEKYMVEHFAPEIEHWIVNEFAPEIEKWVTESFAGTLENWVNEELTPELIGKIKGEVNEQLKNTKESRLDSIKETIALLENISPNSPNFQPASSIINENSQDEPIYIREMPKELRPKYNMASQAVKENLARRAKLYDFTVEGALERFWSSFDSIVESFQNQPTVNQPIILDSKEQSIREALRKRFKR